MNTIRENLLTSFNYLMTIRLSDVVDILIVALIIYELIIFIKKTHSYRVANGILVLILALWLSGVLKLTVINFLLNKTVELGLLALVILFQPELRRGLEKVGSSRFSGLFSREARAMDIETAITQTVLACAEMSRTRTGVLIIFERDNHLGEQMNSGTIINADTTAELLKNIFHPNAPLHDGAVIIRDGRIAAAGCMLPLSSNTTLSKDLGMRHRAGIGMSEHSDAVVVIVSEETGSISVAVDGMLKRHLASDTFEKLLRNELMPDIDDSKKTGGIKAFINKVIKND